MFGVLTPKKHRVIREISCIVIWCHGYFGGFMSKNEKTKFTVYLDEDMLRKTDKAVLASGLKSRNEFIIKGLKIILPSLR